MRYEKTDRIQYERYCCTGCFFTDVLSTLFDESNDTGLVHIIADDIVTEELIKLICQIEIEGFEFDLSGIEFKKREFDEFLVTISTDGEVFVDSSTDKNGEYYECDGFIFADIEVDSKAFEGNNRRCDTMIFEIDEFDEE